MSTTGALRIVLYEGTGSRPLDAHLDAGEITVNLRAEAAPEHLEAAIRRALSEESRASGTSLTVRHLERFRPRRPTPTHRLTEAAS